MESPQWSAFNLKKPAADLQWKARLPVGASTAGNPPKPFYFLSNSL